MRLFNFLLIYPGINNPKIYFHPSLMPPFVAFKSVMFLRDLSTESYQIKRLEKGVPTRVSGTAKSITTDTSGNIPVGQKFGLHLS